MCASPKSLLQLLVSCFLVTPSCAAAGVVISELMFHPRGFEWDTVFGTNVLLAEDARLEWIELHNTGDAPVDLSGWEIDRGIDFVFPSGTEIGAGAYLIVAADVGFLLRWRPDLAAITVGGWEGRLSNTNERIRLTNADGETMVVLDYATQGDWAVRARDEESFGYRGWTWWNPADGEGHTLENLAAHFPVNSGQTWSVSDEPWGTPGAPPRKAAEDVAPVILEAIHAPLVPPSSSSITISARILDDHGAVSQASLNWRVNDLADFSQIPMTSEGGDDVYRATIPPQAFLSVIEFYIEAEDQEGNRRTWPSPARVTNPEVPLAEAAYRQITNASIQVLSRDSLFNPMPVEDPDWRPLYHLIMTKRESDFLTEVQRRSDRFRAIDSQAHGTFISRDGTGTKVRYRCSFRDRGATSRSGTPVNFHVAIPNEDRWNGRRSFQLNSRQPFSQAAAAAMFQLAGVGTTEAEPVRVRWNGIAPHGRENYVRAEPMNSDWIARLYPHDRDGNLYRLDDHERRNEFVYVGNDADDYRRTFIKRTNADADDYSDIFQLTKALNEAPAESYRDELEKVIHIDQWLRFLAINTLVENLEGGLGTGRADDFGIYRGTEDTRFVLVPHDFDTTMDLGDRKLYGRSDPFVYANVDGWSRMFTEDVSIIRDYYRVLYDLTQTIFREEVAGPILDHVLDGWADNAASVARNFLNNRRDHILSMIPRVYTMAASTEMEGSPNQTEIGLVSASGRFNVLETGSILVNGEPAQLFYRTTEETVAGEWRYAFDPQRLQPGQLNVTAVFYAESAGQGDVVHTLSLPVTYEAPPTVVSGVLGNELEDEALIWSRRRGPYHLAGEVIVPDDKILTIEPGVVVRFAQDAQLTVRGGLVVRGEETAPVRFEGLSQGDHRVSWQGIRFHDSLLETNMIQHADFADLSVDIDHGVITLHRSRCRIESCQFLLPQRSAIRAQNSSLSVDGCLFEPAQSLPEHGFSQVLIMSPDLPDDVRFIDGLPVGGELRFSNNRFIGNENAPNIIHVESGWASSSPVFDCRDNDFRGPTNGCAVDVVRGDAQFISNEFYEFVKMSPASETTAPAIRGANVNGFLLVSGNRFMWVDHALELGGVQTAIFEHNDCLEIHPDHTILVGEEGRTVPTSAIHLTDTVQNLHLKRNRFEDQRGGASGFTRIIGGLTAPDERGGIQLVDNLVDALLEDPAIGSADEPPYQDPQWGTGNVTTGSQQALDQAGSYGVESAAEYDLRLAALSWDTHERPDIILQHPGKLALRWRLNEMEWSEALPLGNVSLPELTPGDHQLEVQVSDLAGQWETLDPIRWTLDPSQTLIRINEIQAVGDDAVELVNLGAFSVDLSEWTLTKDLSSENRYPVSEGAMLESGALMVVDLEALGIGLDREGDTLYLLHQDEVKDEVAFGHQTEGYTLGRDHEGTWRLHRPSMGSSNGSPVALGNAADLWISEFLATSDVLFRDDWIELYHPGILPISLARLRLTDNASGDPEAHVFPELSFMAPQSYLKLIADGRKRPGHVNFSLAAEGDGITLLDEQGDWIDSAIITTQMTDTSTTISRTDDQTAYARATLPTDGFASSSDLVRQANILLEGLRIRQIHFDPQLGPDYEFLEFTNVEQQQLNLTGVRITDGVDFTFPRVLLSAGQSVFVVRNRDAFISSYGQDHMVAGEYSGKLNNGGERLRITLPEPSNAAILDFRYDEGWLGGLENHSLVAGESVTAPAAWREATSWATNATPGGVPIDGEPAFRGFAAWTEARSISDPLADDDLDGLPALIEYAAALEPHIIDAPVIQSDPGSLLITLGPYRSDLEVIVQVSDDLVQWRTLTERTLEGWDAPAQESVDLGERTRWYFQVQERYARLRVALSR